MIKKTEKVTIEKMESFAAGRGFEVVGLGSDGKIYVWKYREGA